MTGRSENFNAPSHFIAPQLFPVTSDSPFGVPDRRTYAPPLSPTPLLDPVVRSIAASHQTTPANVILAWHYQLGIVFNPRSQNAAHIVENIGVGAMPWWTLNLSDMEMEALSSRPQVPVQ
jgi:diketogulonate reductase-like aldo/keto reductase